MAPALTSSNPFHLPTTTTTIRRRQDSSRQLRLPKPFVCAKKQGDGVPSAKPKVTRKVAKSLPPAVVGSSSAKQRSFLLTNQRRKDPNTVFVAGATGQAGVRIVQTLLREGFAVRAGVSDLASAQELARLAAKYKVISGEEAKRLNAVESSFDDPEAIAKAIGNADKLVITIGPCENGPSAEVTTTDALEVVNAAELAGVGHVAVVYDAAGPVSNGTSTYNILDGITLFFNNLFSKSQPMSLSEFLSKVVETDVSYTLIKAVLTDDISANASSGIVVYELGAATTEASDYNVSKLQIASLVAGVCANTSVAENKVVEVHASPSATSKSIEELFSSIPVDGRRNAYKEAMAKAKAEEEALIVSKKALEAADAAKKVEEDVTKLSKLGAQTASLAEEAPQEMDASTMKKKREMNATGASLKGLFSKVKDLGSELSWEKMSSQLAVVKKVANAEPKVQIAAVRGQAKVRNLPPKRMGVKKAAPPKPKTRERSGTKPEVRNVFGGLFKQQTIYVDDV